MRPTRVFGFRLVALSALFGTATACASMTISQPGNDGDRVCAPAPVAVTWTGDVSRFGATLDGTDITSQFSVDYTNRTASAQLAAPTGTHTLEVTGQYPGWLGGTGTTNATRTFSVVTLGVAATPAVLPLARPGSATSTISASGCGGTVNLTVGSNMPSGSLPNGVVATPGSFSLNLPAPGNPGAGTSASRAVTLQASAGAPQGQYAVEVNATSGSQSARASFTLEVGRPTVTSVTPAIQARGGTVTIAGTGFDPACAVNAVTIGGTNLTPTVCSPAGTSLSVPVPAQAAYGATTVTVTVAGLASNARSLTVARQPGTFVAENIPSNTTNHMCVNPDGSTGNVQVQFSQLAANRERATYTAPGRTVGTIDFDRNTGPSSPPILNVGGGGFSACTAGIVLDAASPRFLLLNVATGATSERLFNFSTSVVGTYLNPGVFRSPDGTVVLIVTTGSTAQQQSFAFIDVDRARFGQDITSRACPFVAAPSIDANNQIVLTCGGGPGTTTTTIPIP